MFDLKSEPQDPATYAQFKTDAARLEYARIITKAHTLWGWAKLVTAVSVLLGSAYLFLR